MKITVSIYNFLNAFKKDDGFSYEGLKVLYDHLLELEEDLGVEFELDHVAIRCEWSEYETIEECLEDFTDIKNREELEEKTTVLDINGGGIIMGEF